MGIDILNLEPTTISRTLRDKSILIYSKPKKGKTTFCAKAGALICGFENGIKGISGAHFIPVTKWSDFKSIIRELKRPEAHEKYETVAIDTVSIAWDACEQFICAQNGVSKVSEIPYGQGYAQCKKEFERSLREIVMMG